MQSRKDIEIIDTYRQQGLRRALIKEVKRKGIGNEQIWQVMGKLPRHIFVEHNLDEHIYADKAFPINNGQTISQPSTVAYQTQMLDVKKGELILEVGTGSGYQAAVLHELGCRVFSIERHKVLFDRVRRVYEALGYHGIKTFFGDGYLGLPMYAPFDKILVTAAAPEIPQTLKDQLRIGGRLVIPVGKGRSQQMMCLDKISADEFKVTKGPNFSFVPMLSGKVRD